MSYEIGEWVPLSDAWLLPNICGLYIVRNRLNGMEYVGKSISVRARVVAHRTRKSPHYFGNALRKYGISEFEVCLHAAGAEADILALEIQVIAERGTLAPGGYNATIGGEGCNGANWSEEARAEVGDRFRGRSLSEESRRKVSDAHTLIWFKRRGLPMSEAPEKVLEAVARLAEDKEISAQTRAAIVEARKGVKRVPRTAEHKRNLSLARKGKVHPSWVNPDNHPRAHDVAVWEVGSMLPRIFGSGKSAAEWAGCTHVQVVLWSSGKRVPKNGRSWAYL